MTLMLRDERWVGVGHANPRSKRCRTCNYPDHGAAKNAKLNDMKPNHAFLMKKFWFRFGETIIFIKTPGR